MSVRLAWLAPALTALVLVHPHSAAALFGDTDIKAEKCSIATGVSASNNKVTCNSD